MKAQAPIRKEITGIYDFDADTGALGAQGFNAFIPPRSLIIYHATLGDIAVTSGGAALISLGFTGTPQAFLAGAAIAGFSNGAVLNGVDLPANSIYVADGAEMIFTIENFVVTGGKFSTTITVLEFPSPIS